MKKSNIFNDKRGIEIGVVLVVIFTIALVGSTIASFISKNNNRIDEVIQSKFLEKAAIEKGIARLFLEEKINSVLKEAIKEIGEKKDSNSEYDLKLKTKFVEKLKNEFYKKVPENDLLIALKWLILQDKFFADFKNNILNFKVDELAISSKNNQGTIVASQKISLNFEINVQEKGF